VARTVILLSDEAKERYAEHRPILDELETFVRRYEKGFTGSFTPVGTDALSIDEKATLLSLCAFASARQLTWSIVHAINGRLASALFLAVRAHSEMTGLVAYLLLRLQKHRAGQLSGDEFEMLLGRLTLGRFHGLDQLDPELAAQVQALPVSKLVAAVDNVAALFESDRRMFKDSWGWLSEFCHPNALALFAAGYQFRGRTVVFNPDPSLMARDVGVAVAHSALSHGMFFHCFDEVTRLVSGRDAERS
jgi:hypothetical protein